MSVAEIILQQMGGSRRLSLMVGATNFLSHEKEKAVSFRFKGNSKINYLKVTLNGRDTYDMEFGKVYGQKYTVVKKVEDVYNDSLKKIFEDTTKLYLSF